MKKINILKKIAVFSTIILSFISLQVTAKTPTKLYSYSNIEYCQIADLEGHKNVFTKAYKKKLKHSYKDENKKELSNNFISNTTCNKVVKSSGKISKEHILKIKKEMKLI